MLISCAARRRRRLVAFVVGEVLMEPGGAPSELSFHQQGVSSSFDHRAKGKGTKRAAFAVLLTRIFLYAPA
jgi:hypothetical protein